MSSIFSFCVIAALFVSSVLSAFADRQTAGQTPALPASAALQTAREASDDRYIIEFHQFGPQVRAAVRAAGGKVIYEFPSYSVVAAQLPAGALRVLQNNPSVKFIEVDPRRYPLSTDDMATQGETKPYGIAMVQADQVRAAQAWKPKICIIDSGYYHAHEDVQNTFVTASPVSGTGDPFTDDVGHGTHVTGTIAAIGGNGKGVIGVVPNRQIQLHIVKIFGADGQGAHASDLVNALSKCRDAGAHVVNLSLGSSRPNRFEQRAFDAAAAAGLLSVAAAGNAGTTQRSYPASYSSVISVTALNPNKTVAEFSQQNNAVELAAPGVAVLSTVSFKEQNTLTVDEVSYTGNYIQNAARTTGVRGALVDGGLCASAGAWSGKVVLCERGEISFNDKVKNVQKSGGAAAVIYNNEPGNVYGTLGKRNRSTIPAISLSQEDGRYLLAKKQTRAGTVVSTVEQPASGYERWDGTSMATPHVAGVAALVWSYNPAWSNAEIRKALQATAEDLGPAGKDNAYGYGLVQAKAALDYLVRGTGDRKPDITP